MGTGKYIFWLKHILLTRETQQSSIDLIGDSKTQ